MRGLGDRPAYALFGAADRLGVNYSNHGHAFTVEDWTAMMDFFAKHLLGGTIDRAFDRFPTEKEIDKAPPPLIVFETPSRDPWPNPGTSGPVLL